MKAQHKHKGSVPPPTNITVYSLHAQGGPSSPGPNTYWSIGCVVKMALADFSQGMCTAPPGTGVVGGNNLHSHLLSEEIRAWDFAPKQGIKDSWFGDLNQHSHPGLSL